MTTPTTRYGGWQEVADALAEVTRRPISRQQIHTWYVRRARNGFPTPHHSRKLRGHGNYQMLFFDIDEVITWYWTYTPDVGGRRPQE
jgi:hypothetical protein